MESADKTVAYRRILVPLDGSERSEAALPHAVALARQFGGRLLLYRAIESPMPAGVAVPPPGMPIPALPAVDPVQLQREARDAVARDLERHSLHLREQGVEATTYVGEESDVAAQIVEIAREEAIDLIVMATHGRTGLGRLLFGSVAESVLRHATTPVLLIRTRESE